MKRTVNRLILLALLLIFQVVVYGSAYKFIREPFFNTMQPVVIHLQTPIRRNTAIIYSVQHTTLPINDANLLFFPIPKNGAIISFLRKNDSKNNVNNHSVLNQLFANFSRPISTQKLAGLVGQPTELINYQVIQYQEITHKESEKSLQSGKNYFGYKLRFNFDPVKSELTLLLDRREINHLSNLKQPAIQKNLLHISSFGENKTLVIVWISKTPYVVGEQSNQSKLRSKLRYKLKSVIHLMSIQLKFKPNFFKERASYANALRKSIYFRKKDYD